MQVLEQSRVKHRVFGEGTIIDQRHYGHEFLVRFPNSLRLWIKKNNLTFLDVKPVGGPASEPAGETASKPAHGLPRKTGGEMATKPANETAGEMATKPANEPTGEMATKPANEPAGETAGQPQTVRQLRPQIKPELRVPREARSVIEAFRLGIIPVQAIREWTVGRSKELERVKQWLQDESSGTMIIRGEYGSGKSHLIEYLHASGFDLQFAVSLVGIDPSDAQPGFPKRVYRHLIRNLRFPYQGQYYDFREMITLIARNSTRGLLSDHHFLGKFLEKVRQGKDTPRMWEWIEGQETDYSALGNLYDHTTAANIYCNILSGLSSLAVEELGLRGVLLMFDEAETSRTYHYTYEWTRALNFFNALSLVANDESQLLEEEVVRGEHYHYGRQTGLIYSGHLPIPYLYQIPSFLKVAFAFTPDYKINFSRDYTIYDIELESLPARQMEYLFYRFADLYEKLYHLNLPKGYRKQLFELIEARSYQSTRKFIKAMVEGFDFCRFYPSENLDLLSDDGFSG